MPAAFLFDIGNVIITFDHGIAASRIAAHSELDASEAFTAISDLLVPFERGEMEVDEFLREATARIGYRKSPQAFREAMEDIFTLNDPMARFIEERHENGHDLFLLSNTNAIHVPFFESNYPIFNRFGGRIYSHEVGHMKPDSEIYEIAISQLSLTPENTIYIDDLPENCRAGENAGLTSIPYDHRDHEAFLSAVSQSL